MPEPGPGFQSPGAVVRSLAFRSGAVGEVRGDGDEELVFNGAVGFMGFVPPEPAAGGVPACEEVGENVLGRN